MEDTRQAEVRQTPVAYLWPMDTRLYDEIEVHPNASPEVIRGAYMALMNVFHPDKRDTVSSTRAKALNAAYDVLSDPVKRAAYDKKRLDIKGTVIDGVRIDSAIAEGGFGKTYKGTHILTNMPVCVKHCSRISPADAAILIEETRAMWDLRHYALPAARNLVKLDDGSLALMMSFIDGQTLEKFCLKPPNAEVVAWIVSRVLNALSYMHRHGIVHGDIKPQNLIVQDATHSVFLVDFGLSAVKPGRTTGSKGYTSVFSPPEQQSGSPLLPQADMYALGVTMIYALTGSYDLTTRLSIPASVPDAMKDFIKRLIVRDPLRRPDWVTEDIIATFEQVRLTAFGRVQSGNFKSR